MSKAFLYHLIWNVISWYTRTSEALAAVYVLKVSSVNKTLWDTLRDVLLASVSVTCNVCISLCVSIAWRIWNVSSARLSVCLFVSKLSSLELWRLLMTYKKSYKGFLKTHYCTPKIQDGWDLLSSMSTWRHFFSHTSITLQTSSTRFVSDSWASCFLLRWSDLDNILQLVQNDMSTAVIWWNSKSHVEFQYRWRFGEFNGMSSQSHLPHCRVLPPGEFNVMIPELRVTLQGAATGDFNGMSSQSHISHFRDTCHIAVTWQNQCHDIAECNISIRHIKNIFRQFFIYLFFVFNAV